MAFAGRSWHSRGRRSGRGYGGRPPMLFKEPNLPDPESSQKKIEDIISADTYMIEDNTEAKIKNVEYVASFNWKESNDATILVPGKPPRWQPLSKTQKLPQDSGVYFRDQNSARFPTFPTEPAIRAIISQNPDLDLSEIEVFGCGNTLGSLLSFARVEERNFRFGVELIGTSLLLVRKTNSIRETIEEVQGYGHTFPEAYTVWERDVKGSSSHQRIIKYDFAGLKCFVRSESDGYLAELSGVEEVNVSDLRDESSYNVNDEQLSSFVVGLGAVSDTKKLFINEAGRQIPQQAIFDLKTRTKKRDHIISVDDFLHRLWVNQTPNFILAFHTYGEFQPSDIHIIDVVEKTKRWESENVYILSKLGGLIHKLIEVAKMDGITRFEVRRTGTGPIQLWTETPRWSALPADLKALWKGQDVKEESDTDINEIQQKQHDEDNDGDSDSGSSDGGAYLKF